MKKFLSKIRIEGNCWVWYGSKDRQGYSRIQINKRSYIGHRLMYEYYHGDIDPNLTIDHLCRNHACVNPEHLEQVTLRENILRGDTIASHNSRKTHCPFGHEYSGTDNRGKRICKICKSKAVLKIYYRRLKR